jgi:phage shock protein C
MDKRLFRNEHEKVIAGVSSGIAEYMEVDVTIIRLLFVLSTIFLVGTGMLVYVIMWIVVPVNTDPASRFNRFNDWTSGRPADPFGTSNPFSQPTGNPTGSTTGAAGRGWTSSSIYEDPFAAPKNKGDFKFKQKNNETGRTVGGLFLLVIGMYFLLNEFDIIPYWFNIGKLWPLVFVAIGLSFILKSKQKNDWENWKRAQEENMASPAEDVRPADSATSADTDMPEQSSKIDDRFIKKDKQDEN